MKHYISDQFTATFFPPNGVPAGAVIALLSQLRLGALVIDYREPAEEEA